MSKKPPRPRTERRRAERAARSIVQDREKLFLLSAGGSRERPIDVVSPAVIDGRVRALPCVQCDGEYELKEHNASAGLREIRVVCRRCHAPRVLWFRLVVDEPN